MGLWQQPGTQSSMVPWAWKGGQGDQWPLHFSDWGHAPLLFGSSCSKVKDTPVDLLLNVQHDEKECTKSLHLRLHFQKSSQLLRGTSPLSDTPLRYFDRRHFGLPESDPPLWKSFRCTRMVLLLVAMVSGKQKAQYLFNWVGAERLPIWWQDWVLIEHFPKEMITITHIDSSKFQNFE